MPTREAGGGGPRKRKPEDQTRDEFFGRGTGGVAVPPPSPSPTITTIDKVERESARTLPTSVVLGLAGLGLDDRDTVRAARVLAKQFEIRPYYIFGTKDPSKYTHPITGEPLTMKEALRFTDQFAPVAVASMLSEQLQATADDVVKGRGAKTLREGGEAAVDPNLVAKWARVVGRNGGVLRVEEGMGVAVYLARTAGVKPERFEKNMMAIRDWAETSGQPLDERSLIEVTLAMTQKRRNIDTANDVFEVMVGGKAEVEKLAKAEEDIRKRLGNIEELESQIGTTYGRPIGAELSEERETLVNEYIDYELLAFTSPDLWQEVKTLEKEIALREDAFQRSLVGKALDPVFRAFDQTWEWTEQGLIQLGTGIVAVPVIAGSALGLDPQGEGVRENLEAIGRMNNYAFQRIKRGDTVGDFVREGYGLPSWTAPAFDFMVGWYVDPFVIAGKVASFNRARRVLPGLQKASLAGNALINVPGIGTVIKGRRADVLAAQKASFIKHITKTLPESHVSKKLFRSLGSNTQFFRELDRLYGTFKSRGVFDYEYMKLLKDRINLRFAENGVIPPKNAEAAFQAWKEGLTAHYTGWAPEGTVAAEVVDARRTRMMDASRNLDVPPEGVQLDIFDELHPPSDIVNSTIQETLRGTDRLLPFSPEAPAAGFLADIGPRRAVRGILTSPKVTATQTGRRAARLISQNPGRMANIEDAFDEYAVLHARRWGVFDEVEVRTFQSRVEEILNSGYGREARLEALIDEMNVSAIRRAAAKYNLSDEATKDLTDSILEIFRSKNQTIRAFGTVDGKSITRPLFESQLKNTFVVVDPIDALREIRQFAGMRNHAKAALLKAVGKVPAEQSQQLNDVLANISSKTWDGLVRGGNAYQRGWKALTVARPGYIPRVILGDENARFLATTQSLAERLLSQEWGMLGKRGKAALDKLFDETIDLGDGVTITLKRPGAYDYEPLATGKVRETELLADMLRRAGTTEQAMKNGSLSWNVISAVREQKAHLEAWHWALTKQFRNSAPGRIALESVARGDSIEATRKALVRWAQDDKFVTLTTRIGREAAEVDEWASVTSRLVHGYTMGNKNIADLVLAGDDDALRAVLDGVKKADRPPVHGPTIVQNSVTSDGDTIRDFTNWMYKRFVRQPEDVLNRQPFYKTWKRRAERGYLELLKGQKGVVGANGVLNPDIARAIDQASREFALGQVRRIMFDFTRQSRFTEILQMAFPFPQPFFEGFQAWGHIAWRNPEAIGRAKTLFRMGKDSGFIREDPVTGELVVGMGVYAHAARLAALLPGIDKKTLDKLGLSFVAPLSSFNMLAASTLKVPSNGVLGRIAGGMPIPVPGMNVPLQMLAQKIFANTSNEALTSWLFQYGPNTSALPSTVKRVANILNPGFIKEGREESYALAILERWQQLGLDRDEDGKLIDPQVLAKMANTAAEDLAAVQGFVSLMSPAALRAQFGTEDLKAEWAALIEEHGFEKAREIWDERYPDLPLIPIANTFYTDPDSLTGEQAGYEGANAPRIPASPFTDAMLKQPGIGDFMRNNPEWAALILVGVDPTALESQDFSAFAKQLADHLVAYKDPERFAREGQDALAWREIDKFYTQIWTPGVDKMDREGLDTQDDFYQGLIQARQEAFLSIALEYPDFAARNFEARYDENGEIVGYDWDEGFDGKPMTVILEDARRIASMPGMETAPGFRALNQYLNLRDEIEADMAEEGVRYLDQLSGKPYWKKYEAGVKNIIEQVPEFEPFLGSYFGVRFDDEGNLVETDDLMGSLASDRILARRGLDEETLSRVDAFDAKIEQLRDRAYASGGAELSFERSQLYVDAQRAMDTEDPKLVARWWKVQDEDYKREYRLNLATKPPEFYSRHDWSLVGVDLSKKASEWFIDIADARAEIARREQEAPGTYSEAEGYEDIDRFVKAHLGKDKSFAEAVKKLNRWSFPVEAAGYTSLPGKTGRAWRDLADILNETQAAADSRGLLGVNYGGEEEKNQYGFAQNAMAAWVEDTRKAVPGFRRTWDRMKEEYGDVLIGNVFLPDNYFGRLGVVD